MSSTRSMNEMLVGVIRTIKLFVRLRVIVYRYVNFMYIDLQVKWSLKFVVVN